MRKLTHARKIQSGKYGRENECGQGKPGWEKEYMDEWNKAPLETNTVEQSFQNELTPRKIRSGKYWWENEFGQGKWGANWSVYLVGK